MARYAEWYAVELDGYLKGRMSDVARFEAIKEVNNHFAEHVDDLVAKGMDPVEAEKAAIKSFGSPRNAAINLLPLDKKSKLGRLLTTLGCVAGVVLMFVMVFFSHSYKMEHWMFNSFSSLPAVLGASGAILVLGILFGALLTRKVPATMLILSSVIGIAASAGYLLLGPEVHFSDVRPDQFNATMTRWRAGNVATLKLDGITKDVAKIVDKFKHKSNNRIQYYDAADNGRTNPTPEQKAVALASLKKLGESALALNCHYVTVNGTTTTGYLVPKEGLPSPNREQDYSMPSAEVKLDEPTRFPYSALSLVYTNDPDLVIPAWQNSGYVEYSSSVFESIARRQEDFLSQAVATSKLSRSEVAREILQALVLGSVPGVLALLTLCWLATKVPQIVFQPSFRRRVA